MNNFKNIIDLDYLFNNREAIKSIIFIIIFIFIFAKYIFYYIMNIK